MNLQNEGSTSIEKDHNANQGNITNIPSSHSLSADLATGWRPKLKIIGPMPLNYDNKELDPYIDSVLSTISSFYYAVYLGSRPFNTFLMHDKLARNYKYKYQHLLCTNYLHLKAFFHKFYSEFEPKTRRPFTGMNPSIKNHTVSFDSSFECGNLDCAIKVKQNEYDLVLRIDSNTRGHIQWFYFKVRNLLGQSQGETPRTIKFNIVNFRKNRTSYQRGMRPYIKRKQQQWVQGGENVSLTVASIRFGKGNYNFSQGTPFVENKAQQQQFKKLSFQLTFEPGQEVQVAYSIPYPYSRLMNFLKDLKKEKSSSDYMKDIVFDIDYNIQSLSGLQIPYLRITEQNQFSIKKKYVINIIARQHPGQSNSSFVIQGIINALLQDSEQMKSLRQKCEFHIIPMVNPDGVVAGNFRTSLYGKDLNRLYKKEQTEMVPEIQCVKKMVHSSTRTFKQKFILFLDIHGHSVRRNSFAYGPGSFSTRNVTDVRMLAKLISNHCEIFRFPSCSFRISQLKKSTARAVFSKYAEVCYTIETSNWSFSLPKIQQSFDFNVQSWRVVGKGIASGMASYVSIKYEQRIRIIQRRKKNKEKEQRQKPVLQKKSSTIRNSDQMLDFRILMSKSTRRVIKNSQRTVTQSTQGYNKKQIICIMKKDFAQEAAQEEESAKLSEKKSTFKNQGSNQQENQPFSFKRSNSRNMQKINRDTLTNFNLGHFSKVQFKVSRRSISRKQVSAGEGGSSQSQQQFEKNEIQLPTRQLYQIDEGENESDKYSDKGFDSQSSDQDMEKQKFKKYFNAASQMVIEFEKAYYGDDYQKKKIIKNLNAPPPMQTLNSKRIEKKIDKKIDTLACLRKNIQVQKQLSKAKQINLNNAKVRGESLPSQVKQKKQPLINLNYRAIKKQVAKYNKTIFPKIQINNNLLASEQSSKGNSLSPEVNRKTATNSSINISLKRIQ